MAHVSQNKYIFECVGAVDDENHHQQANADDHIDQYTMQQTKYSSKRRKMLVWHSYCAFVIVLFVLPMLASCQFFSTRDPRYYNREGDFHYRWPNPGDPDYR